MNRTDIKFLLPPWDLNVTEGNGTTDKISKKIHNVLHDDKCYGQKYCKERGWKGDSEEGGLFFLSSFLWHPRDISDWLAWFICPPLGLTTVE